MNLLELIKNKKAIRKFKNKAISENAISVILEAGRWSSSIHGIQPWKFIVTRNTKRIEKLSEIMMGKSKKIFTGANVLMKSSAFTIAGAKAIILVYNTGQFRDLAIRFGKNHSRIYSTIEISAIGAALQNMILIAESLGIGNCWLSTPIYCQKEINKYIRLENDYELTAMLVLGYPDENGQRSERKDISKVIQWLK